MMILFYYKPLPSILELYVPNQSHTFSSAKAVVDVKGQIYQVLDCNGEYSLKLLVVSSTTILNSP